MNPKTELRSFAILEIQSHAQKKRCRPPDTRPEDRDFVNMRCEGLLEGIQLRRIVAEPKKDAAELMGISQRALSYYLAKYRLD